MRDTTGGGGTQVQRLVARLSDEGARVRGGIEQAGEGPRYSAWSPDLLMKGPGSGEG